MNVNPSSVPFAAFLRSALPYISTEERFQLFYRAKFTLLNSSLKIPNDITLCEYQYRSETLRNPYDFKSFFSKSSAFIIWLISAYELFRLKSVKDFDRGDWDSLASFFPNYEPAKLRFKFFSFVKPQFRSKAWTIELDSLLRFYIGKMCPILLQKESMPAGRVRVSWAKISLAITRHIDNYKFFKSAKHCKERWFNHLNPFLNKNYWTIDEDIRLLSQSQITPKKWALISRSLTNRNQHQIKNRFICLLSKETGLKNEEVRECINKGNVSGLVSQVLAGLRQRMSAKEEVKSIFSIDDFLEKETNYDCGHLADFF